MSFKYNIYLYYIHHSYFIKIVLIIFILFFNIKEILFKQNHKFKLYYTKKKRIGIIGLKNHNNIGNNLVKFSMYTFLKECGLEPIVVGITDKNKKIYFLKKHLKLKEINNSFTELKENDYDILMVNSDQTWNSPRKYLLDQGFLRFAKNWKIPKFVYGASLGHDYWKYSKSFDKKAKLLIKDFNGISVREKSAIGLVKKHLGINPQFVLDPTLLIDKNYYLDLLKDYKNNFNLNNKYLCVYQLDQNDIIEKFIKKVAQKLNFKIYRINRKKKYIEKFIFAFNISRAVITDSYHGTIFSIIFNKSFISYINKRRGSGRFISLRETFNLKERIVFSKKKNEINMSLLVMPLNINHTLLSYLKNNSIKFLKNNIGLL